MKLHDISPVIQPKYEADVRSFSRLGNAETSFTLRGHTANELVEQFRSIELAEKERNFDAFLPREVFELAEFEAKAT
jgi:hypothetical protein